MRLRPHRRNLVVWRQSDRMFRASQVTPPARSQRVRFVFLVIVVGARRHWPLLAGVAFTVAGLVDRAGWVGLILLPGLLLLLSIPLIPTTPEAERLRRSTLERELAVYTTTRQRFDLEAMLDRYPDSVTGELRDILTRQALTADSTRIPGGLP